FGRRHFRHAPYRSAFAKHYMVGRRPGHGRPNRRILTMSVKGKTILVTGASQGIGRGIALRLARDGANIALVDIKADKLDSVRKEVEALGVRATTFRADVSKRDEVYAAIDHAEKELGGFDVIVNN